MLFFVFFGNFVVFDGWITRLGGFFLSLMIGIVSVSVLATGAAVDLLDFIVVAYISSCMWLLNGGGKRKGPVLGPLQNLYIILQNRQTMPQKLLTAIEIKRTIIKLVQRSAHRNLVDVLNNGRIERYGIRDIPLEKRPIDEKGVVASSLYESASVERRQLHQSGKRRSVSDGIVSRCYK